MHTYYVNIYIDYEPSWLCDYDVKRKTNQLGSSCPKRSRKK